MRADGCGGQSAPVAETMDLFFGGAQAVFVDLETGTLHGAADPRRDGAAVGS